MLNWIMIAAIAIGGSKHTHHKPTKPATTTKTVWVCEGNSYMVLKKGFTPKGHKGCHKTKIRVDSDMP